MTTAADITVKNPSLGTVELNLVQFRHGEWSYEMIRVAGEPVYEGCNAEPMPKRLAEQSARRFGRTCRYISGLGYCA